MFRKYKMVLPILVLGVLFIGGCANYQPIPLTDKAVAKKLSGPDMKDVRIKAGQIKHPILKPVEFDDRDGLSPDEAAVLAVLANPRLRMIRDQQAIANSQLLQAGLLPNPQLSYNADFPTGGNTDGTVNAFGLGLDWDIGSLIAHQQKIDAAKAHADSVNLEIAWQEWQVAQAAKAAVYQAVVLNKQIQLATQIQQRLKDNLNLVQKAVEQGQLNELDLAAARTAYNQANSKLANLEKSAHQQRLILNEILGLAPTKSIGLQSDIKLPDSLLPASYESLIKDIDKSRLDLVALRMGYNSQEAAVRSAILKQFPGINIGFNQARDTGDVHSVGFAVSISLPIFNRNQGQIALQRATRKQLFDEYVNRIFQTHSDIAKLTSKMQSIHKLIYIAEVALPDLEQLVKTYRLAVNQGQADVLSYYTAWNSLTEKKIEILSLKGQMAELNIALELACGQYNINSIAGEAH